MSRYEKGGRKKRGIGSFITTLLLIVAIGVFLFSAYKLVGYYLKYKVGTDEYSRLADNYVNIQEPVQTEGDVLTNVEELEHTDTLPQKVEQAAKDVTTENGEEKTLPLLVNPIDFTSLHAINEDVIGWIRLGALDLSYPVVQGADNDYYLHRTFERKDNFAGSIFLNCTNSKFFTDQNSIVYGHNMKNGSMFGTLKKFHEQEIYDGNPYFWIFTPTLIYQYKIFSAREVALTSTLDVYNIRFTTEDFGTFLQNASTQSVLDNHGMTLGENDRVVTLSTCTGSDTTRFIVQGKLEQIYIAK